MDRAQALPLLERITGYWGLTLPSARVEAWLETLEALDEGAAGTTLARLKATSKTAPTPADFVALYNTLVVTDGGTPPPPRCGTCSGTGWTTSTDHPRHWPGRDAAPTGPNGECWCNVVTPCTACPAGQTARDVHRRIHMERQRRGD